MEKKVFTLKVILLVLLVTCILFVSYLFLLAPKEKRFSFAEHSQGSYLSQKIFDILIFQYPNYSNAYFEKSVAYNKRGDYKKGFELLNKAVEIAPKDHLGYRGWLKLKKLKDYQGCIEDLTKLDSLTPNVVDAPWGEDIHYLLGLSYKGLKKDNLALREFNKSIASQKDSSWVNHNLFLHKGIIFSRQNKIKEALDNLNACLRNCYDKSPEAYFQKGVIYRRLNLRDSSKVNLEKSLSLYKAGYANKDVYNELQDELYRMDIEDQLSLLRSEKK